MRQALRRSSRRQTSIGKSVPAPVGGWDALSPLANMKPEYAIRLDNWFPEAGYCRLRRGFVEFATGLGTGAVESLLVWEGPSSRKFFGACDSSIFDITAGGAVGAAALSALSNARWQHVNFKTSGGSFLFIVNGSDAPRTYDGSAWATPTITGVTASDMIQAAIHKRRIWGVLKDTTKAAYLATNAIAGAATEFDFGPLFSMGGYLNAIGTWTLDGGNGPDDYLVAISSRGQCAIYAGTDPASADAWELKGVFNLGAPIGRRCLTKVGGDLALISVDGVVPLSKAIVLDRGAVQNVSITARIQPAMASYARLYADHFGWQIIGYPRGTMAILNVPTAEGVTAEQGAMNTVTGAWCKFTGMNASCWEIYDERPFFGAPGGVVYEADKGATDDGEVITAELKTAFNYFGSRGTVKKFEMIQPLLTTDGSVTPGLAIDVDFADGLSPSAASSSASAAPKWDEVQWDEFDWSGGTTNSVNWDTASGVGQCAAIRMRVSVAPAVDNGTDSVLYVNGFNMLMQPGGPI